MKPTDIEQIKKKLNELDLKVKHLSQNHLASLNALIQVLADKGITNQKEFKRYLSAYKKFFAKVQDEAEFIKLISQLKKKGKK